MQKLWRKVSVTFFEKSNSITFTRKRLLINSFKYHRKAKSIMCESRKNPSNARRIRLKKKLMFLLEIYGIWNKKFPMKKSPFHHKSTLCDIWYDFFKSSFDVSTQSRHLSHSLSSMSFDTMIMSNNVNIFPNELIINIIRIDSTSSQSTVDAAC